MMETDNMHPDVTHELRRTIPRPGRAFTHELEQAVLSQLAQPQTSQKSPYRRRVPRWTVGRLIPAAAALAVAAAAILLAGLSRAPATQPLSQIPLNSASAGDSAQLQVPLSRFDVWALPDLREVPAGTPVDIWVSALATGVVPDADGAQIDTTLVSADAVVAGVRTDGNTGTQGTLAVLEMNAGDVAALSRWVAMDAASARLIVLPAVGRPAPAYALTESYQTWRQPPGQGIVALSRNQIAFLANDLIVGDWVSIAEARLESNMAVEPLTDRARLISIGREFMTPNAEYYVLQVYDDPALANDAAERIDTMARAGSQFALLGAPPESVPPVELPVVSVPAEFVIDASATSAAMAECAVVDVLSVALYVDAAEVDAEQVSPGVTIGAIAWRARVLAAPLVQEAGWALELASRQEADAIERVVRMRGMLYLNPTCP
jgi:hypothetical protein